MNWFFIFNKTLRVDTSSSLPTKWQATGFSIIRSVFHPGEAPGSYLRTSLRAEMIDITVREISKRLSQRALFNYNFVSPAFFFSPARTHSHNTYIHIYILTARRSKRRI